MSRYCRTTLLGSGPRKMYTSRIPPVDLQLRAGLGCRTTSGGSSPGAQRQILTTPLAQGLRHCTNGPNHRWRGGVLPQGAWGPWDSHSEPSLLRSLEQDRKTLSSWAWGPFFWPQPHPAQVRGPRAHLRGTEGQSWQRPQPNGHFSE